MGRERSAAAQLRLTLAELGWSQAALSEAIDVSKSVICRLISGDRTPTLTVAFRLEDAIGLPARAWCDVASRRTRKN